MHTADTVSKIPMTKQFNLTLTITGSSLDDIDQGLMEAAGERIRSRMTNPPAHLGKPSVVGSVPKESMPVAPDKFVVPANPVETVAREEVSPTTASGTAESAADEGKRGVKPGTKRGSYKKDGKEEAPAVAAAPELAPSISSTEVAPNTPTPLTGNKQKTLDDAINALKMVNAKFNSDKARE